MSSVNVTWTPVRLILWLTLFCTFISAKAQQSYWSSVENYPGYQQPLQMEFQDGKGLWAVNSNGLYFVDAKTSKITLYNLDDSSKQVTGLRLLVIVKGSIYVCNMKELFKLSSTGQLQRIFLGESPNNNTSWSSLYATSESLTIAGYSKVIQLKNDKVVSVTNLPVNRYNTANRSGKGIFSLTLDLDKFIVRSSRAYAGINVYDKAKQLNLLVSSENPVDISYQAGKGLWLLCSKEILLITGDSAKPVKKLLALPTGENTEKLVLRNNGQLEAHTSRFIYNIDFSTTQGITITQQPDSKALSFALYRGPLVLSGKNYYYANPKGLFLVQGTKEVPLIKNLVAASNLTANNRWMPDGFIYSNDKSDMLVYNGKQDVVTISSVGYGSKVFTDGKKQYIVRGNAINTVDAKGTIKPVFEVPSETDIVAAAAPDGTILTAGRNGVGIFEKGKLGFKPRAEIQNFPAEALHSVALGNDKQPFLFFSKPYLYNGGKLNAVSGDDGGMMYTSYFDGFGGMYSIGIGEGLYYDGTKALDLKTLIKMHFKKDFNHSVYLNTLTVDYKGRCWLVASYKTEPSLLLIEKGKIIDEISVQQLPVLSNSNLTLYSKGKEILMLTPGNGMSIYKLK